MSVTNNSNKTNAVEAARKALEDAEREAWEKLHNPEGGTREWNNDSIPDPEGYSNHLTHDQLDLTGDHSVLDDEGNVKDNKAVQRKIDAHKDAAAKPEADKK